MATEFRALVEQRREGVGGLGEYFAEPGAMLGAVPYAQDVQLRRVEAFAQIARNARPSCRSSTSR